MLSSGDLGVLAGGGGNQGLTARLEAKRERAGTEWDLVRLPVWHVA